MTEDASCVNAILPLKKSQAAPPISALRNARTVLRRTRLAVTFVCALLEEIDHVKLPIVPTVRLAPCDASMGF